MPNTEVQPASPPSDLSYPHSRSCLLLSLAVKDWYVAKQLNWANATAAQSPKCSQVETRQRCKLNNVFAVQFLLRCIG